MKKIILTVKDDRGNELSIGDTVSINCRSIRNRTYYTTMQLVNGRLFPHDFFSGAWIEKIEGMPEVAGLVTTDIDSSPAVYVIDTENTKPDPEIDLSLLLILTDRKYSLSEEEI